MGSTDLQKSSQDHKFTNGSDKNDIATTKYKADDQYSIGGKSDTSLVEEEVDTQCGYVNCKADCLQKCAKPRHLLVCLCVFALVESHIQWGLVNTFLATWERRYQLRSTQSAWIVTTQDITSGVLSPIFGYLATFYHKGKMITAGTVLMFVGCFMFLIPHFASGNYLLGGADIGENICDLSSNATGFTPCEDENTETDLSKWLVVFCVAQGLFGYVSTSLWTIGITYLDENCRQEDSALFLGILNAVGAFGAVLGFIGGGMVINIYVDVGRVDMDTIDIVSSDPRWVGAWWITFAVATVACIPSIFLMGCFPHELPGAAKFRARKKIEAHKGFGVKETSRSDFGKSCADLGYSLKVVFGNPVFILITIAGIVEVGGVSAFAAYLPRIIQFQFGQSASGSALIAGLVLVPGAVVGQLLGGIIPKVAKLQFRGIMWMLIISQFICVLCALGFLAKCPSPQIAGFNAEYPFNSSMTYDDGLIHSCNAPCNCTTIEFEPICSKDGISYFTPCHGACAVEEEIDGKMMYGNCSCLPNATSWEFQAEGGMCTTECSNFWIFMPLLLVMIIATFIENTGGYAVVMRIVPEKERTLAFGVQAPIIRYLGNVPIPILFGLIFDMSCEVWQDNCGKQGSCWVYDTQFLSLGMFTAALIIKGVSGICFLIGICIYKPPKNLDSENEIKDEIFVDANEGNQTGITDIADKINGDVNSQSDNAVKGIYQNGTFQDQQGQGYSYANEGFDDIVHNTRF